MKTSKNERYYRWLRELDFSFKEAVTTTLQKKCGLSLAEVARRAGVSRTTPGKVLSGKFDSGRVMEVIVDELGFDPRT